MKLKREDVEERGPLACEGLRAVGGPLDGFLRRVIRGALFGFFGLRVEERVKSRWFFIFAVGEGCSRRKVM